MLVVQALLCSLLRFFGPAGSDNVVTPCWEPRYKAGMKKNKDALSRQDMLLEFPFLFNIVCIASEYEDYGCTLSSYAFH